LSIIIQLIPAVTCRCGSPSGNDCWTVGISAEGSHKYGRRRWLRARTRAGLPVLVVNFPVVVFIVVVGFLVVVLVVVVLVVVVFGIVVDLVVVFFEVVVGLTVVVITEESTGSLTGVTVVTGVFNTKMAMSLS
jgi:hypothetical protein